MNKIMLFAWISTAFVVLVDANPVRVSTTPIEATRAVSPDETVPYPSPEALIPVLDTNGIVVGTVRQVMYAGDTNVYYLTDTASPQKPWKVQLRQFVRLIERRERAEARAKEKRPGETIEATRTNLLAAIETSTGKKQQDAIVRYLEWLTLEVQTLRGED